MLLFWSVESSNARRAHTPTAIIGICFSIQRITLWGDGLFDSGNYYNDYTSKWTGNSSLKRKIAPISVGCDSISRSIHFSTRNSFVEWRIVVQQYSLLLLDLIFALYSLLRNDHSQLLQPHSVANCRNVTCSPSCTAPLDSRSAITLIQCKQILLS